MEHTANAAATPLVPPVPTVAPIVHPTACPSWCVEIGRPMDHHFGPTSTSHFSRKFALDGVCSAVAGDEPTMMRASLYRLDTDRCGETVLSLYGETETELTANEADIFIGNLQAFLNTVHVLRRGMDGGR